MRGSFPWPAPDARGSYVLYFRVDTRVAVALAAAVIGFAVLIYLVVSIARMRHRSRWKRPPFD
jgi:hypothetical protein